MKKAIPSKGLWWSALMKKSEVKYLVGLSLYICRNALGKKRPTTITDSVGIVVTVIVNFAKL
jgi:hypothetical protein